MYPLVDLCPSLSPAHSESVYPTSSCVESDLNVIPNSKVPAKYWKIWISKLQFVELGIVQYQLRTFIQ